MAKEDLKPMNQRTKEEQKKIATMGGIASGKARKQKKLLKECLEELLEKEIKGKNGESLSGAEAISVKLFKKALQGDLKAFEVVRDTAGQKPVEKVMVAEVDEAVIDEVERAVRSENDE